MPLSPLNVDTVMSVFAIPIIGSKSSIVKDFSVPNNDGVLRRLLTAALGSGKSAKFKSLLKPNLLNFFCAMGMELTFFSIYGTLLRHIHKFCIYGL